MPAAPGYTRQHQMTLGNKRDGFRLKDLVNTGKQFGIKSNGKTVIERVRTSLMNWSKLAREWEVPGKVIAMIKSQLRLR